MTESQNLSCVLLYEMVFPCRGFQTSPKTLNPFKMDLDLWDCFGGEEYSLIAK